MATIVTLIAAPAGGKLDEALVACATARLPDAREIWLHPDYVTEVVCDADIDVADMARLRAELEQVAKGSPVDMAVHTAQPDARRKKILIADMDSTMIQQECIDELAAEAGIGEHIASVTARAMRGEIGFEESLRDRVACLKGLPLTVIDTVIAERIALMPGGPDLVRTMRANGAWCALISGGFIDFTSRIAARIGFQEHRANRLLYEDGVLTGKVAEPILGRQAKADALREIAAKLGLDPVDALAVGDGANDLAMLSLAGMGVALHAKPKVAEQADIRIDHNDLTALLYLQGYRRDEFAR
ncbi:phosphoserine phosphatase SerB [Oricola sp.]|uniref:phosphoserine phosphatase SerB n=1 Tax=Oricola sp. TaxID=1979950 RepID=UPI003BAD4B28